jgi:hypothetical protein
MQRIDLDLQQGWKQDEQCHEREDDYRVECVGNIEMDTVLSASIVLKVAGSGTQRIGPRNLSTFHFLALASPPMHPRNRGLRCNPVPCVSVLSRQDSMGIREIPVMGDGARRE